MVKSILESYSFGSNVSDGDTDYFPLGSVSYRYHISTEANVTNVFRTAGVLRNLYFSQRSGNTTTGASTIRTRKNTTNGSLTISVPAGTSGEFNDDTNHDVVSAGEDWHYQFISGGGGVIGFRTIACTFESDVLTDLVLRMGASNEAQMVYDAADTTYVGPIMGNGEHLGGGGADADVSVKYRNAGTLDNYFIYVQSNGRASSTTTFRSRVNAANGNLVISVTASSTGSFEDTSNSDTIAVDDLINYSCTTGTGTGSLVCGTIFADFTTTGRSMTYAAAGVQTRPVNEIAWFSFSGGLFGSATFEDNVRYSVPIGFFASSFELKVTNNTITAASTLISRVNKVNSNFNITIPASTTGVFSDIVNQDFLYPGDNYTYQISTGATGTDMDISYISFLADRSLTPKFYNRFKKNIYAGLTDFDGSAGHEYKVALVDSTYRFNPDHNIWTEIDDAEISGTGYVIGGGLVLNNLTVTQDDTNDLAVLDLDDVVWTDTSFTTNGAVIYDSTMINKDLVCFIPFGQAYTTSNGDFTLRWNTGGLINIG